MQGAATEKSWTKDLQDAFQTKCCIIKRLTGKYMSERKCKPKGLLSCF
jgi:hypothetical protein